MNNRKKNKLIIFAFLCIAGIAAIALWNSRPTTIKVGIIPFTDVNERVITGFKEVLAERGFLDGYQIEYRSLPMDGDVSRLDERIKTLLAWKPDLLLSCSTPASQAAFKASQKLGIPLVFAPVTDPIDAKIVSNLSRPGENTTGIRLAPSNGLRLQWLHQIAPKARYFYLPYSINDKSALASLKQIESAAHDLGLNLLLQPVDTIKDIEKAAREIPSIADAIILPQDSRIESHIQQFVALAIQKRLPLSAPSALQVEQGALMSFGFSHHNIGRQAGRLATEILSGIPPGDLPVESAENMLYINQQTAIKIGLFIDDATLRQAGHIIR